MLNEEQKQNLLGQYDASYKDFVTFAEMLKNLTKPLVEDTGIQYQNIQLRVKTRESLSGKLDDWDGDNFKKITEIVDIIGLRIIVYTDQDSEELSKKILQWFDNEGMKPRLPTPEYQAYNLKLKLDKTRRELPEYKQFKDFRFEIQVATVINHAWIEQIHDVLYKGKDILAKRDPNRFEYIKTEYEDILEKFLTPAQDRMDFLSKMVKILKGGGEPFYPSEIDTFSDYDNNNIIYEKLENLKLYVNDSKSPIFNDIPIISTLINVILKAQKNSIIPIKTSFGKFRGKSSNDIVNVVLSIYDILKYLRDETTSKLYLKEILERLIKVYTKLQPENKNPVANFIGKIVPPVWQGKNIYFVPSKIFLEVFKRAKISQRPDQYIDIIKASFKELLSLDIEKATSDKMDSLTIHSSSLPVVEHTEEIRNESISELKNCYENTDNIGVRFQIVQTLHSAMYSSFRGGNTEKHKKLIHKNTNNIVDFYKNSVNPKDYTILHEVEHQVAFLNKSFRKGNKHIISLLNKLRTNDEYQLFKLFFGWEYFLFSKSGLRFKSKKKRLPKIIGIASEVTLKEIEQWVDRIKDYLISYRASYNYTGNNFRDLEYFFEYLSENNHIVAQALFEKLRPELKEFSIYFIKGFWKSDRKYAEQLVSDFIKSKEDIYWLSWGCKELEGINPKLIEKFILRALKNDEVITVSQLTASIMESPHLSANADENIGKALTYLTRIKNTNWVNHLYIFPEKYSLIDTLDKKTVRLIMDNLLLSPSITYEIETLLSRVLLRFPLLISQYFKDRIQNGSSYKKVTEHYSPVPFELHYLDFKTTEAEKDLMQDIFNAWRQADKSIKKWQYSRLFSVCFTKDIEHFTKRIIEIIDTGEDGILFALEVLKELEGKDYIDNICKAIVKKGKLSKDIEKGILWAYEDTGVVEGQYGLAQAFKQRLDRAKLWLTDPDTKVQKFATKLISYLEARYENEFKSAENEEKRRSAEYKIQTGRIE